MARTAYGHRIAHGALLVGYMSRASTMICGQVRPAMEGHLPVSLGYDKVRFLNAGADRRHDHRDLQDRGGGPGKAPDDRGRRGAQPVRDALRRGIAHHAMDRAGLTAGLPEPQDGRALGFGHAAPGRHGIAAAPIICRGETHATIASRGLSRTEPWTAARARSRQWTCHLLGICSILYFRQRHPDSGGARGPPAILLAPVVTGCSGSGFRRLPLPSPPSFSRAWSRRRRRLVASTLTNLAADLPLTS